MALDFVPGPPALETVTSPGGHWSLDIAVVPGARTGFAQGTMRHRGVVAWRHGLAAPTRPRFAVVADDGAAALFGCWDNIPRDVSIEILAPSGARRGLLEEPAIVRAVGVPMREIVAVARHGVWLDRVPRMQGGLVWLGSAGRALVLDLEDGTLRAAPG